jgi:hypothetical protein
MVVWRFKIEGELGWVPNLAQWKEKTNRLSFPSSLIIHHISCKTVTLLRIFSESVCIEICDFKFYIGKLNRMLSIMLAIKYSASYDKGGRLGHVLFDQGHLSTHLSHVYLPTLQLLLEL